MMMRRWGNQQTYKQVIWPFNETFHNENNRISKITVVRTIQRFEESNNVRNRPKSGRPATTTNENKALDVLQSFVEDPHISINRVAQHKIGTASIHKIFKKNKWHPYKFYLVQEFSEDDFDRRVQFCDLIMEMINDDPLFIDNIVLSNEATFELTKNVNKHNCRYWSEINLHWIRESHTQHPQKVNVWGGIFRGRLVLSS